MVVATFFMHDLLQFGLMTYLVTLGLMSYLTILVMRSYGWVPFVFYCAGYTLEGIVQFTVIATKGNAGIYVPIYWTAEYIQSALVAWIVVDIIWRWKNRTRADDYILTGVVVTFLFPAIVQYRAWVPIWTRDIPVYSMLVSQAIWIQGLILESSH